MENSSTANPDGAVHATRSPYKYIGWGCGVLVVLIACACVATVGLSFIIIANFGGSPEHLSVDYELPSRVAIGEKFDLILILTNTGKTDITVGDIDLDEALGGSILDGAIVLETDPNMDRDYSIPGIKTFHYNRVVAAGESQQVTIQLQALTVGEYGGSIGVYVGTKAFRINTLTITVTDTEK